MKITADTNVLLSATLWEGDSFRILEKVKSGEIELVLSNEILEEYSKVLFYEEIQDKIKDKALEIKTTVEELKAMSTIVSPFLKINAVKKDPADNKIIECALEGKVDYLVTNDNHLLELGEYRGIKIIKPEEFLTFFHLK
jgi:putative PIN family toxin of toxin-antitoxin system